MTKIPSIKQGEIDEGLFLVTKQQGSVASTNLH
jgi:hypothetical protein